MNPFTTKPEKDTPLFVDWEKLWVKPYDKQEVDPYTRTRVILMTGTEFENVWFSHQFSRCCGDNDLRRELALLRRALLLYGRLLLFCSLAASVLAGSQSKKCHKN